jgi:hypothetical protein
MRVGIGLGEYYSYAAATPVQVYLPAASVARSIQLEFVVRSGSDERRRDILRTDRFTKRVQVNAGQALEIEVPILIPAANCHGCADDGGQLIIFGMAMSRVQAEGGWHSIPLKVRAPLYLNPLFFLTSALVPKNQLYPEWFECLGAFVAVALLCAGLTLRNLRRSGDIA